jgi:hypothetical protein
MSLIPNPTHSNTAMGRQRGFSDRQGRWPGSCQRPQEQKFLRAFFKKRRFLKIPF